MKKMKKLILSLVMLCLMIVMLPAKQVTAEENESLITWEAAEKASSKIYLDLSDLTFTTTDVRNGKTITFDGSENVNSVFVFGGIGSCSNTNGAIEYLNELTEYMDMSKINIYVMDVRNNTLETILNQLNAIGVADDIFVCNSVGSVYSECRSAAGLSGYTMPFIVYVNAGGKMYDYTTGATTIKAIAERLTDGGVNHSYDLSLQTLYINGNTSYTYAYEILELLNEARVANGLSAIQMDEELLEVAMQRAAECGIYYDHARPDGGSCFTASTRMSRENIAAGYRTPEAVMNGWLNSSGHYKNIMATDNQSVGIGCVQVDGVWYWAQCFGRVEAETPASRADGQKVYTIAAATSIKPYLSETSGTLSTGEQLKLTVRVNASWTDIYMVTLNNNSWKWSSSNESVATVDTNGVIIAKSAGTAEIVGKNVGGAGETLKYILSVTAADGGTENGTTGDGAGNGSTGGGAGNGTNEGGTGEGPSGGETGNSTVNGLAQAADGNWYYYVNGKVDFSFTGLYSDASIGWWFVRNGQVAFDYSGLYNDANYGWWLIDKGAVAFGYTGLYGDANYGWWLISGGAVNFGYTGLYCDANYGWWLVGNGAICFDYTGLWCDPNYGWWLVGSGAVCFDYTGLWCDPNYGWWLVGGGAVCFDYNGLRNDPNYGWWLINGGTIPFGYTGLYYDANYGWWYIEGGALGFNYTGEVYYNGAPYYVVSGQLAY